MKTLFVAAIAMFFSVSAIAQPNNTRMLCAMAESEAPHIVEFRRAGMSKDDMHYFIDEMPTEEWKRNMSKISTEIIYGVDMDTLNSYDDDTIKEAVYGTCMILLEGYD